MRTFVVTYLSYRGCNGHENIFPDEFLLRGNWPQYRPSDAMAQLASAGGFYITSENRRSHAGPPVFVPYHAVIAITEREE